MRLFGSSTMKDERVEALKNKVSKEAYWLVVILCHVSVLIKWFVYGLVIEHVITEIVVVFVSSIYYLVRLMSTGVYSDDVEMKERATKKSWTKKQFIMGAMSGVILSLLIAINSANNMGGDWREHIGGIFLVFVFCIILYVPFLIAISVVPHVLGMKMGKRKMK